MMSKHDISSCGLRRFSALILIMGTIILLLPPAVKPTKFVADDSYFYLQIAQNIVVGHGSTFNQVTSTNGYHPLWMLFCTAAFVIPAWSKHVAILYDFCLYQALPLLGTILYFSKIAIRLKVRFWHIGVPVFGSYLLSISLFASEAYLNAFLGTLASFYMTNAIRRKPQLLPWIYVGIIVGLFVLARLDNVFLAGSFILVAILSGSEVKIEEFAKSLRSPHWVSGWIAILFRTQRRKLLANYLTTEHFMPISGAIKYSLLAAKLAEGYWGLPCARISLDWLAIPNHRLQICQLPFVASAISGLRSRGYFAYGE